MWSIIYVSKWIIKYVITSLCLLLFYSLFLHKAETTRMFKYLGKWDKGKWCKLQSMTVKRNIGMAGALPAWACKLLESFNSLKVCSPQSWENT